MKEYLFCMYYLIGLSRNEVFNETLLFLVAGYDTTSSALAWFIHLMSKNLKVQKKIKQELMKDSEQLTLDQLDSLVYLDCVIKEVLRFCPPIIGTLRTLTVDDCLPESGFQLQKGDSILIPFHNLARDTRYWSDDPEIFYPERFLNEDQNHHPYAFVPFGGGHRACIGQDLARFELKVIAARLMQYVTFGDGGPEINGGGHTSAVIKPKHLGVTVTFDL
jgi:cytochrome P450